MRYVAKFSTSTADGLKRHHATINDREWRGFARGTVLIRSFRARYSRPVSWDVEVSVTDEVDAVARSYGFYRESDFAALIPDDAALVEEKQ